MSRPKYPGVKRLPDGRYHIRVKARCPKTGRVINHKATIEATSLADANRAREAMRRDIEEGATAKKERQTVEAAAKSWLKARLPEIRESTASKYATMFDTHILPALGSVYVDMLAPSDVIAFREEQSKKAKPASVNTRLQLLRTFLADVCAEQGISNPAERVRGVRQPVLENEFGNSLKPEELGDLLDAIRLHYPQWFPVFATLAYTGARVGEVTALKWDDIDFERQAVRIVRAHHRQRIDETKTGVLRTIALAPPLVDILRAHQAEQQRTYEPDDVPEFVFVSKVGTLLYGPSLRKPLLGALQKAGIDRRFTVHGFRHTFNNLARQEAHGDVVRSMTGHVTPRMTSHYSHVGHDEKIATVVSIAGRLAARQGAPGVPAGVPSEAKK